MWGFSRLSSCYVCVCISHHVALSNISHNSQFKFKIWSMQLSFFKTYAVLATVLVCIQQEQTNHILVFRRSYLSKVCWSISDVLWVRGAAAWGAETRGGQDWHPPHLDRGALRPRQQSHHRAQQHREAGQSQSLVNIRVCQTTRTLFNVFSEKWKFQG